MIHLSSDYSELDAELDRLSRMPTFGMRMELDGMLHKAHAVADAEIHVETGALKASGKEESDVHRTLEVWEGTITWGTPGGENSPVGYAIYEKARGVGGAHGPSDAKGDHNWITPLLALDAEWKGAILRGLKP